jgi:hypothetical protein
MRLHLVLAFAICVLLVGPAEAQSSNGNSTANCVGSDAETKDPKGREAVCLRELGDRASRSGNVLSLKLDSGKTKVFRNDPEACGKDDANHCANYYLVGFHPSAARYLVYATYYEDFECKLVSVHTGKVTTLRNIPHFAPDGATFFVTGFDGSYDNWLNVGSMSSDPPALVWETGPLVGEDWGFVRWIDNDRIALRNSVHGGGCPDGNCEAVLKRTNNTWTLERLPRESGPEK